MSVLLVVGLLVVIGFAYYVAARVLIQTAPNRQDDPGPKEQEA